jgi:hypothetical protein
MEELPYCKYLYVLDPRARQITANISRAGLMPEQFGRDRGDRPYLAEALAGAAFSLSESYISRNLKRPSLTAVRRIESPAGETLGYLGADFDLRELPPTQALYRQPEQWMQMKGDPAIRAGLFHQERVNSLLDERIDEVLAPGQRTHHRSRRLPRQAALLQLPRHRLGRRRPFPLPPPRHHRPGRPQPLPGLPPAGITPPDASIPATRVREVLNCFKDLRFMDETLYLRSGSLNIFNGMVGLTFSCDGSHYMPWDEFSGQETWGSGWVRRAEPDPRFPPPDTGPAAARYPGTADLGRLLDDHAGRTTSTGGNRTGKRRGSNRPARPPVWRRWSGSWLRPGAPLRTWVCSP